MNDNLQPDQFIPPIPIGPDQAVRQGRKKFKWWVPVLIIGLLVVCFVLLVGSYFGGGYYLARQINTQYAAKNCEGVVSSGKTVQSLYPPSIVPYVKPALEQYKECQAFIQAVDAQNQKSWESAYTGYVNYLGQYPQGIVADKAQEGAAQVLISWAQELESNQDYATAVEKLSLVLQSYSNTTAVSAAREGMARVLLAWARQLAGNQDYETAIEKLSVILESYSDTAVANDARESMAQTLLAWAKVFQGSQDYNSAIAKLQIILDDYGNTSSVGEAKLVLAQIYLDWARAQQSQGNFADAEAKYEAAIAADPDPQSVTGPAAQARAALPQLYLAWGDKDAAENQFQAALSHYAEALQYATPEFQTSVNEARARCQVKWALYLSGQESFYDALPHLDEADNLSPNDNVKTEIDDARDKILDDFSNSSGDDAQDVMAKATKSLCESRQTSEWPIVGINPDEWRVAYYFKASPDKTMDLSPDHLATTPGNLHYVACITETTVEIERRGPYRLPGGTVNYWCVRQRIDWTVELITAATGERYTSKTFTGSNPATCQNSELFRIGVYTKYKIGSPPSDATIDSWLSNYVK